MNKRFFAVAAICCLLLQAAAVVPSAAQMSSVRYVVEDLGKLSVLAGVREFPVRVKCASLAWHTLKAALDREQKISTE